MLLFQQGIKNFGFIKDNETESPVMIGNCNIMISQINDMNLGYLSPHYLPLEHLGGNFLHFPKFVFDSRVNLPI